MAKEEKKDEGIALSDAEKSLIESQRKDNMQMEEFQRGYQKLVEETGFGLTVDGQSTLAQPRLTIVKVQKQ